MSREDPKSLIREAYKIQDLDQSQCRSIFLDWVLSLSEDVDAMEAMQELLRRYEQKIPQHPMTEVLKEGLLGSTAPRRRGGWRSRARPRLN